MKNFVLGVLFLLAVLPPLSAIPEEGFALRFDSEESGLYATHRTYPIGTKLTITNLVNQKKVQVQVGGRMMMPEGAVIVAILVELSFEAADRLGFNADLGQVRIEEVPQETRELAVRPRVGAFRQVGIAEALAGGTGLTAAHPSLPLGARARISNTGNGRETVVTINGRIRASRERVIEITNAVAQALRMGKTAEVIIETNTQN
jgi:rare lipoprotein A (peptidoglycan hydrolase)